MGRRKKTHEEFVVEVKALVGDEYTVVGTYVNAKTKVKMFHVTCGTIYQISPNGFLRGRRCPSCFGTPKKTTEEFKEEVFKLVKDEYEVVSEYGTNHSKVKMFHVTCGTIYQVEPRNFLIGRRCPSCFGTPKKTTEEFKEEVFKLVKDEYEVVSEYNNSRSKIDMLHVTCGEVYPVTPTKFLIGRRCPSCFGLVKKTTEEFKEEVFKLVKDEYEVVSEYAGSHSKIDMLHVTCGEVYPVTPDSFLRGNRCPKCNESKGEREISQWLSATFIGFESQVPIRYERGKKPLYLDFLVQGVAIEYDGEYHYKSMSHAGGEERLQAQQERDRIKDKYCADNGIPLIRIPYWDFDNIDAILTEKLLPLLREKAA